MMRDGHRYDYAECPDYVYLDGRGHHVTMPRASGAGCKIRFREGATWKSVTLGR